MHKWSITRKTRKEHACLGCLTPIAQGLPMLTFFWREHPNGRMRTGKFHARADCAISDRRGYPVALLRKWTLRELHEWAGYWR